MVYSIQHLSKEAVAVKCSKCGSEIPSQSRFCLSCGQSMEASGAASPAPAPAPKKKTVLFGIIAGLLIVAAIFAFALRGKGVTSATPVPNGNQTPVVNAPSPPNGPNADLLKTNVKNQPIDLNAPKKTPPPADVVAYLAHLQKVEDLRMALKTQEEVALINIIPHLQVDPLKQVLDWSDNLEGNAPAQEKTTEDKAKDEMKKLSADWQKLAAFFLSVPAPQACQSLATKYYDALRDVISTTGDLQAILISGDVGKAYTMQGKSSHIDDKLIAADQELGNICTQYGIDKSFSIKSDTGMAPVMGLPSTTK